MPSSFRTGHILHHVLTGVALATTTCAVLLGASQALYLVYLGFTGLFGAHGTGPVSAPTAILILIASIIAVLAGRKGLDRLELAEDRPGKIQRPGPRRHPDRKTIRAPRRTTGP